MRGHPRGLCENDSTNTVSARENVKHFCYCAREFIVGHFCGLSENDRKSCCHFQKAREDVPIQDFTAQCLCDWSDTIIYQSETFFTHTDRESTYCQAPFYEQRLWKLLWKKCIVFDECSSGYKAQLLAAMPLRFLIASQNSRVVKLHSKLVDPDTTLVGRSRSWLCFTHVTIRTVT